MTHTPNTDLVKRDLKRYIQDNISRYVSEATDFTNFLKRVILDDTVNHLYEDLIPVTWDDFENGVSNAYYHMSDDDRFEYCNCDPNEYPTHDECTCEGYYEFRDSISKWWLITDHILAGALRNQGEVVVTTAIGWLWGTWGFTSFEDYGVIQHIVLNYSGFMPHTTQEDFKRRLRQAAEEDRERGGHDGNN